MTIKKTLLTLTALALPMTSAQADVVAMVNIILNIEQQQFT